MTEKHKDVACTSVDKNTGELSLLLDEKYPVAKGLTAKDYAGLTAMGAKVTLPTSTGKAIAEAPDCGKIVPKNQSFVILPVQGMEFAPGR
jgi:hypothetical protein